LTITEQEALETYRKLLPDRRLVTVPGREILLGGGNVHCITQQVPRAATRNRR
jgi:agmatine deiminase